MKISILGAGNVGGTLGKRWLAAGHDVRFGVRNSKSEKVKSLRESLTYKTDFIDFDSSTKEAEVLVLCVPWVAVKETLEAIGSTKDKIIIDVTNPLIMNWEGLNSGLAVGTTDSGGEQIQQILPEGKVVKAFNTIGWELMANPDLNGQPLTLPLCGEDTEAKKVVSKLAAEIGFEPVDVGPLKSARYTEPLAMLWIDMAILRNFGRKFGFQIIRR